ncbi:MAG: hypothetical protein RIR26_2787 [Pseudomonadota bacterium]
MNAAWLATIVLGVSLSGLPLSRLFFPAGVLRSLVWNLVLSAGTPLIAPLRGITLLSAMICSLPLLAAIPPLSGLSHTSAMHAHWEAAVFSILFLRVVVLPGMYIRWASVVRWEQEVVRRDREKNWGRLRFLSLGEGLSQMSRRTWALSRQLARTDTFENSRIAAMPVRNMGLFCLYLGLDSFPRKALISVPFSPWLLSLGKIALLLSIFTISVSNIMYLFSKPNRLTVELDSLPIDRKYFVLKRISENIRWFANPEHLMALLMQADVLAATLRISIH